MLLVHVVRGKKAFRASQPIHFLRSALDIDHIDPALAIQTETLLVNVHDQPEPFVIAAMAKHRVMRKLVEGILRIHAKGLVGELEYFGAFGHGTLPGVCALGDGCFGWSRRSVSAVNHACST